MSYDPDARRDTPLAEKLKARIRQFGPISVRDYMHACLHDPEHGYYRGKPVIGAAGDFITSPEISQVFGELIGLWSVVVWQQMGRPDPFNLVELGPGRGTLMADALRAARRVPQFGSAARLILVESNPMLIEAQAAALSETGLLPEWHATYPSIDAPTILIGNEFLDTEAVRQLVLTRQGWRTRAVGLGGEGRLVFTDLAAADADAEMRQRWPDAQVGAVAEEPDGSFVDWMRIACDLEQVPSSRAALLIDYGHAETGLGDTLQAVRGHRSEHPLTSPGEADLTVQVDFARLEAWLERIGLTVDGPVPQAELLGNLGMIERASRLMAANPSKAASIEAGVARLMAPNGMGTRFKAMGVRSTGVPRLPGFEQADEK